ncbi:hypothetical protein K353_01314 [Kitasatospora sp. SolWspMP-SS2h]|uniref:hypothetical protein n=1 Tax=Kitasatospora sp. SolWspMP-SS2h TaxID=1305729 RepID=UPI000DB9E49E|nr:hypothetical protein [Kitasatospora sp. SolWspMP-SS2h]RAJ44737.1 hypothetical protein K353_01314 [Kitasatospora sp. SolWspMP-SS2h]
MSADPVAPAAVSADSGGDDLAHWLLHACALDASARSTTGAELPDWRIIDTLTAVLNGWERRAALATEATLATAVLALQSTAYLLGRFDNDHDLARQWLLDFGHRFAENQAHPHSAGPAAIEVLDTAVVEVRQHPGAPSAAALVRIGAPVLDHMRPASRVEDARELLLTLGLWAGNDLARLADWDADRIADRVRPGAG